MESLQHSPARFLSGKQKQQSSDIAGRSISDKPKCFLIFLPKRLQTCTEVYTPEAEFELVKPGSEMLEGRKVCTNISLLHACCGVCFQEQDIRVGCQLQANGHMVLSRAELMVIAPW